MKFLFYRAGKYIYAWLIDTVKKKYNRGELSYDEIVILEKVIGKPLNRFFDGYGSVFVKVVDIINDKEIGIFKTRQCATRYIKEKYGFNLTNNTIDSRLNGKVTTPYKGRFMFYYATDEEVKKYLEESQVN